MIVISLDAELHSSVVVLQPLLVCGQQVPQQLSKSLQQIKQILGLKDSYRLDYWKSYCHGASVCW